MTKPKSYTHDDILERTLMAMEDEVLAASDEEIADVLDELGIKPEMKGSAAFADMRYFWLLSRGFLLLARSSSEECAASDDAPETGIDDRAGDDRKPVC